MARRPRIFGEGLVYHVIARGNHRQPTFLHAEDYQGYLERLARYRRQFAVVLYAYCLMPNHVHLLLQTGEPPLARFMQGVQQTYTQYFNRVHGKVGHLFQGRYKAIVCEKDTYLIALIRYIHANPVRAGLVRRLQEYPYSGHGIYLSGRPTDVLDPRPGLRLFGGAAAYQRFCQEGLGEGHRDEYYQILDQRFLGPEEFGARLGSQERPLSRPKGRRTLNQTLKTIAAHLNVSPGVLKGPDRGWRIAKLRTLTAYTLVRRAGFPITEVAVVLGRDITTVSASLSRFSRASETVPGVRRELQRLAKIV